MKCVKYVAIAVVCLLPAVSFGADIEGCICRAKGVVAMEGEVVCLTTANGPKLARCEKVLNNTSWKILPDSCGEKFTQLSGPQLSQSANPSATISPLNSLRDTK